MPQAAESFRSTVALRWLCPALAAFFALPLGGALLPADEPGASYIFPAGGQQGTVVAVRVGGLCLHEKCPWQMLGPGVTASSEIHRTETIWFDGPMLTAAAAQAAETYPQDYAGSVSIAADAPLGTRLWRLSTAQGATPAMRFIVGDLPEVVEQEQDGTAQPVEVTLPVTINGRIFPREDVDLWTFSAAAGQVVRAQVCAARLGSPLQPQLEVLDERGTRVAASVEMADGDPALSFTAPAAGKYQLRIHDVGYGGWQNHVYRLTLSSCPDVSRVYPLGGRRGSQLDVQLVGSNLAATTARVELNSPTGEQIVRFEQAGVPSNPVLLDVDDLAEILEREPNDKPAEAPLLADSAVCNGRIQAPGDEDLWSIAAKKGEIIDLEVRASRLGSPLDALLTVADATGKQLAEADDLAPGVGDAQLRFAVPADGAYTIAIADRSTSRGGEALAYRLRIDRSRGPDFRLWLPVDALALYRGGEARLKVEVERQGGFAGPIELAFDRLPAGVAVSGNKIGENAAQTDVVLKADAALPIGAVEVKLQGTAEIAGTPQLRWAARRAARGEMRLESVLLAGSLPTPFKVAGTFELRYVPRGSVQQHHYRLVRGGYDGPLEVRLADRQMRYLQGATGAPVTVPAGADEFDYPLTLPPAMETGRTSRSVVTASATIDDGQGGRHVVGFTSQHQNEQIVLVVSPGPLNLRVEPAVLIAQPGREMETTVSVQRNADSLSAVKVELDVPRHMAGIAADPVEIGPEQTQAVLKIRCDKNGAGPLNMPLSVRASTMTGPPLTAAARLELIEPAR